MSTYSNRLQSPKPAIITRCSVVPPEKITRKASDMAEYIELFGSFTQDHHTGQI